MWFQFGGHSDKDSDCINVAHREISEETGINDCELISNKIFDVDIQSIAYSSKKNEPEHFHYDINFLFLVKDKNFEISNESTEIKWVTIAEAKKLISPDDFAMQRMIAKYEKICSHILDLSKNK
jgi:8-oxo-dGTP pyrophosphatase MutT (NUDIX family)